MLASPRFLFEQSRVDCLLRSAYSRGQGEPFYGGCSLASRAGPPPTFTVMVIVCLSEPLVPVIVTV